MLNQLIRAALNHRLLTVAIASLAFVYGAMTLRQIPVDVFPDLNRPVVTILTECPGMAPEEVEALVTLPIETAMNGMSGVERVRSSSGVTLSMVWVEFDWGTDPYRNRQLVAERLAITRSRLPDDIVPVIGPLTSLLGEIQFVGLTTEDEEAVTPMELRTHADWVVRPRLLAVPGVAQVLAIGGDVKQYQILISAERLKFYQFTLEEIEHTLSHVSQNTTGGFLNIGENEYLIRTIGAVDTIEDIENSMVGMHFGKPVLVKDIAEVKHGARPKRGDASVNNRRGVILGVQKQPDASTITVTKELAKVLDDIDENLPENMVLEKDLFKQSSFIGTSIHNVQEVLRDGAILVSIVLFLFLLNFRTTFISLTAIPLSFILTFLIFKMFGMTINTMTLGGLAIAIGELVDDAIVDVENVFRRLQENRRKGNPKSALRVVYDASCEIRGSIVFATAIVILVFIPLFNLSGIEGRLFIPLGIAYIVSLSASLLVSLTVTPVLCSYLLPNAKSVSHEPGRLVQTLRRWDRAVLERCLERPLVPCLGTMAILLVACATIPWFGTSFLPPFQEGTALVTVSGTPGISLDTSNDMGGRAEKLISEIPEVRYVSRRTGRAEEDEHVELVSTSEIDVGFRDHGRPRQEVLDEIRTRLKNELPGAFVNIGQPLSHRIDHMMSGVNSQIAIKLFGPKLSTLRRTAAEISHVIEDVDGLVDVQVEAQTRIPQSKIYLMRDEAAQNGVVVGGLAKNLEMALHGEVVAQVLDEQRTSDVVIRFDEQSRSSMDMLRAIPVRVMPDGDNVFLGDVADVFKSKGPNVINRENGRRRIVIQGNASGRDVGSIVHDIQERIDNEVELGSEYHIVYDGQYRTQQRASRTIALMSCLSFAGIFALLYSYLSSARLTLQVMITIPLAMIGALFAIFLTDRNLSIASLIGFITLCGIASRNAIMMISHFIHLIREEGETFSKEMVIKGALDRLTPVLMTSITAILGLIPLALSAGETGKEILHPLSVVIIGGLISSTLLDIIITPTVFYMYGEDAVKKALQPKESL